MNIYHRIQNDVFSESLRKGQGDLEILDNKKLRNLCAVVLLTLLVRLDEDLLMVACGEVPRWLDEEGCGEVLR